ncbi:hypothetical protein PVAP13_9KG057220 [Panicum virgatum]|uniref:Uncharacterized protein n=1 Tax=Panicum virgatum TaxID=38727 RepID=A0A8T0NGA7_PANVG|nr:hypothetical protein PVAP13_9KG057220 [Panicum virgatum]
MAKQATSTSLPLTMALVALLSVTLHLQAQAVMKDGAPVQEPSRPEQVAAVVAANATNLVCRKCSTSCCEAWGTDPQVCYTSCCYAKSRLVACGCAACRGK